MNKPSMSSFIHESAIVAPGAQIGEACHIGPFCNIGSDVVLGSGVRVEQNGATQHYEIVGAPEADAKQGRISNESPLGRALLGRGVGEEFDVNVPRGVIKIKVIKID